MRPDLSNCDEDHLAHQSEVFTTFPLQAKFTDFRLRWYFSIAKIEMPNRDAIRVIPNEIIRLGKSSLYIWHKAAGDGKPGLCWPGDS